MSTETAVKGDDGLLDENVAAQVREVFEHSRSLATSPAQPEIERELTRLRQEYSNNDQRRLAQVIGAAPAAEDFYTGLSATSDKSGERRAYLTGKLQLDPTWQVIPVKLAGSEIVIASPPDSGETLLWNKIQPQLAEELTGPLGKDAEWGSRAGWLSVATSAGYLVPSKLGQVLLAFNPPETPSHPELPREIHFESQKVIAALRKLPLPFKSPPAEDSRRQ